MPSVARGRPIVVVAPVATVPPADTAAVGTPAVPAAVATRRERALQAALDAVRFPVTRLVRSVAERLTTHPTQVELATLEVEVRDAIARRAPGAGPRPVDRIGAAARDRVLRAQLRLPVWRAPGL